MIKLLDIRKACKNVLKANYPEIPIKSQDIEKGFARPSFTTEFEDIKIVTLESQIETSLNVTIYYFPDLNIDDYFLHLDDVKFNLPLIFGNKLKVLNRHLDINDPESNVVDGVVVFDFDMLFYQEKPSNDTITNPTTGEEYDAELMQELYLKFIGK